MTTLTEPTYATESLISEAKGQRSRDLGTLKSGVSYKACAVLAKFTSGGDAGKYAVLNPAASDGSQTACAILYRAVDATAGDRPGVLFTRDCEHNLDIVEWPVGITGPQKTTAIANLALVGIILR